MRDHTACGGTFRCRHPPLLGGGGNQHLTTRSTRATQLGVPAPHRETARRELHAEDRIVENRGSRCILDLEPLPVAAQFFHEDHRQGGVTSLPHFHRWRHERDGVVGRDVQERRRRARRRHFGRRRGGVFLPDCLADGEVDSQHQAAADAGGAADEVAAGDGGHSNGVTGRSGARRHGSLPGVGSRKRCQAPIITGCGA